MIRFSDLDRALADRLAHDVDADKRVKGVVLSNEDMLLIAREYWDLVLDDHDGHWERLTVAIDKVVDDETD